MFILQGALYSNSLALLPPTAMGTYEIQRRRLVSHSEFFLSTAAWYAKINEQPQMWTSLKLNIFAAININKRRRVRSPALRKDTGCIIHLCWFLVFGRRSHERFIFSQFANNGKASKGLWPAQQESVRRMRWIESNWKASIATHCQREQHETASHFYRNLSP